MLTALKERQGLALGLILLAAFGARLAAGAARDWSRIAGSYQATMARKMASGEGYIFDEGVSYIPSSRALRTPLYPMILGGILRLVRDERAMIVFHAALGTATVWLLFLLGRDLFSWRVGFAASAIGALYPYYVVNDVGLLDRPPFTFALSWATWAVWRASKLGALEGAHAGLAYGIATLLRPTALFFAPLSVAWLTWRLPDGRARARTLACFGAAFALVMLPWLLRNLGIYKRPVLVSSTGTMFWMGQVGASHEGCGYPLVNVLRCCRLAYEAMPEGDKAALRQGDELARDRFLLRRAIDHVRGNPLGFLRVSLAKLRGAYSVELNPRFDSDLVETHGPAARMVYALSYGAILAAALAGLALRPMSPPVWLLVAAHLGLLACTVIFFSHTIHRSALDFSIILLAARAAE